MNETLQFLAGHGYWLLMGAVLGRHECLLIPTNVFLVAAGSLSRSGRLSLSSIIGLSVMAFLLADLTWYEAAVGSGTEYYTSYAVSPEIQDPASTERPPLSPGAA
jgi:membrane protein DedA with SNARE-associated domain